MNQNPDQYETPSIYNRSDENHSWHLAEKQDKVNKKAKIRNRFNRIPYPALNTKRETDTYT